MRMRTLISTALVASAAAAPVVAVSRSLGRSVDQHVEPARALRVWWPLAHQHRQRLLRRPADQLLDMARVWRPALLTAPEPGNEA